MVATILILQEEVTPFLALRRCLAENHEAIIVSTVTEAMEMLNSRSIDLIVSRFHLVSSSMFEFLRWVKRDRHLKKIPFVCFCGRLTEHARNLDPLMAKVSLAIGAEKYISLSEYCSENSCNVQRLRIAIEDSLRSKPYRSVRRGIRRNLRQKPGSSSGKGNHFRVSRKNGGHGHAKGDERQ